MAHISTTARKFRKQAREVIAKQLYSLTYKENEWDFLNPVTNKTIKANALDVEGILYSMVPAAREAEYKYAQGVARLLFNHDEIHSNYKNASDINDVIKIITCAHTHEWDPDLRGMSARELKDFFHSETRQLNDVDREEISALNLMPNENYEIKLIKNFDEAQEYNKYTTWCITSSKQMWDSYSANGLNNVYFILKRGYAELMPTNESKTDDYGLSMISVIVRPYGSIAFCTGRYNHQLNGNDSLLSAKEISELIGRNYFEVFLPKSGKELEKIIFDAWTEVESDEICKIKGWKRIKQTTTGWNASTIYTYYDPEKMYLVFDKVNEPDNYGIRVVELNHKYNLINKNGDLML